jgi:peptide/nickel transport system permease protein
MSGLVQWLARRLAYGALTLFGIAVLTYGIPRWLFPERYHDYGVISGTWHDLERGFLHWDWGRARGFHGAPVISHMFARGFAADLWLIGGALVLGITAGLLGAMWCARRPGSRRARAVDVTATTVYCTPVYVFGLLLILMFNGSFGVVRIPAFFDANPDFAEPWSDPWLWLTVFAVPWLVLAAPLAAMCLRLTTALLNEERSSPHVRTAYAKGVPPRRVMSRHIAPPAYTQTASFVGVSIPPIVLNLILVEWVFAVPGFFVNMQRATGKVLDIYGNSTTDIAVIQALSMWSGVLIVVLGIAVDLTLVLLDPRIRGGSPPG